MLENYLDYLSRKKKETIFVEGLIRKNIGINNNIQYANRLHYCCQNLLVTPKLNGGHLVMPIYPCGVPFCPTCEYLKTRKKVAQFYDIYNRVTKQPDLGSARFYHLTLTVRDCHANKLVDTVAQMKKAYRNLRRRKEVKEAVLSASCLLHYGLNNDGYIQVHFHVLLILKVGRKYIKQSSWMEMWRQCMNIDYDPYVNLKAIGEDRGRAQKSDFIRVMQYGLKSVEYQSIEQYPDTFLSLFDVGKSIRKVSHQGLMRILKRESEKAYKEALMKRRSSNEFMLMKYNGSNFCEDRLVIC